MRTAEEIKASVEKSGSGFWMNTKCHKCDTPVGFLFNYDGEEVVYDESCECNDATPFKTTWDAVADYYSMLDDTAQADIALGFSSPKKVLMRDK